MAHPSQVLQDTAPHKIVIVDSDDTYTGNFFAYTCLKEATAAPEVKGRNIFEQSSGDTYTETSSSTAVSMVDVVGVTIFGDFTEFNPGDASGRYILYVSVEDQ